VVVLHELVHRHELDGGDAQGLEVVDDRRVAQRGVRAADVGGMSGWVIVRPLTWAS
jgi:hypothetical protein